MRLNFLHFSVLIAALSTLYAQNSIAESYKSCKLKAELLKQQCFTSRRVSVDECKTKQRAYYQLMLSRYNEEVKAARDNFE